jgi:hypothetical protein
MNAAEQGVVRREIGGKPVWDWLQLPVVPLGARWFSIRWLRMCCIVNQKSMKGNASG